jgi:hypothetical protein
MHRFLMVAAAVCFALPALAADNASCKLSADRKSVSIVATNPYAQVMHCEVNCNLGLAGGLSTAVCAKDVPVGAKDLVLCTETADAGHPYTGITGSEIKCADPTAAAAPAAKDKDAADSDSDSDEDSDALIKRLQKQSADMAKQLQQLQQQKK